MGYYLAFREGPGIPIETSTQPPFKSWQDSVSSQREWVVGLEQKPEKQAGGGSVKEELFNSVKCYRDQERRG